MTIIDLDSVVVHGHLDLLDDLGAGGFDPQHLRRLHDVIRDSVLGVDARRAHHLSQSVALDSQAVLVLSSVLGDDGSLDLGVTLDDHVRQAALELLHGEVELVTTGLTWLNVNLVVLLLAHLLLLDLQLTRLEDALADRVDRDLQLEGLDCCQVNLD